METKSEYRIYIIATDELLDVSPDIEKAIKDALGDVVKEVHAEFMREEKE